MGLAAFDFAVAGVQSGLESVLYLPDKMLQIVRLTVAELLLPVLTEGRKDGRSALIFVIHPQPLRSQLLHDIFHLLMEPAVFQRLELRWLIDLPGNRPRDRGRALVAAIRG